MKVEQQENGLWRVREGKVVFIENVSHTSAWLFVDQKLGEHINRAEQTTDWLVAKSANGE